MIQPNVFVLNFINFLLGEETNAGVRVFVADITSFCHCVVSDLMELLLSFLHACLSAAAAAISLSSPAFRCCFTALLHFVGSDV